MRIKAWLGWLLTAVTSQKLKPYLLIYGLLLGFTAQASAYPKEIIIAGDDYSETIANFTEQLRQELVGANVRFLSSDRVKKYGDFANTTLIIFGYPLLEWRLKLNDPPPTIALEITRSGLKKYWKNSFPYQKKLLLLWSDPPVARQMCLLKEILPSANRVGIIYSKRSQELRDEAQLAANQYKLRLRSVLSNPADSNQAMQKILSQSDAVIGIHDDDVYNSSSIKPLLLTAYAQQKALIGPSSAFVYAGSLASVYSDTDHWNQTIKDWLSRPPLIWPNYAYPHYFSVTTNPQVARTLGISLAADSEIREQLEQAGCR